MGALGVQGFGFQDDWRDGYDAWGQLSVLGINDAGLLQPRSGR